ncbi:MAG TPA: hypothetical protein PLR74_12325, partial [Agriterribacter sp.]|nr:hypothetical protein [Agriterribacter sp.]
NELQYFNTAKDHILQFAALTPATIEEQFRQSDFQITPAEPGAVGGDLYHHRRIMKDGQLLFLSNASMELPARGTVYAKGKDALLMDPATGQISDYPEQEQAGKIAVRFDIPPAGSLLVFIADKKQQGLKRYETAVNGSVVKGTAVQTIRPGENTLMIDFCDVQLGDSLLKDTHVGAASRTVFMHYGFNRNPWNHQLQFKDHIIARDTFAAGTGYTAVYHFHIDEKVSFEKFRAVIEQGGLWTEIKVNGNTVKPVPGKWWLDRSFGVSEARR